MNLEEHQRVASSFLQIQRHWWAHDRVAELLRDDPTSALATIEAMVAQAESDDLLGDVGAGPLEDLVRAHGEACIDRLEELAARDRRWRTALSSVWIPDGEDLTTQRLERIGCTQLEKRATICDMEESG